MFFGVCDVQGAQIVQLISDYREMLARRRQSDSTTVTVDDAESALDVPTPTGRDRRSPTSSRRSRPTHRPATASSGVAVPRRRLGGGHHRPRSPTSSPESHASSKPTASTAAGGHSGADAGAVKTEFKYKRVKDSVRQPQKRGHLASRKSDSRHEGIFD